ncbi:MAG: lysophospholipid acyltransferase family protein [Candidatus Izemoplasma sp.]|nr:lysophospholipid acyltransferase family protein [Candidatus Izemoplasma sp.]
MVTFIYYSFVLAYTALIMILTDTYQFTHYSDIIMTLVIIILAFIIAFISVLIMTWLLSFIRQNKPKDDHFNHAFARALLRFGLHIFRIKVYVSGKEHIPDHPFVLVGNHQENYDIIIIKPIFEHMPLDFIAKEALKSWPIFGRWIKILGNVFIAKEANRSAARSIIQGIKNVKSGIPMAIFPEGRRSRSNKMIDFKPGAFKLAMKPKADLLIITQYNVCKVFKHFPIRPFHVYVHIHPLMKYEDYKDMNSIELSEHVKGIIQGQLNTFEHTVS